MTVRWVLVDEDTAATITLAVNPNTMDAFPRSRTLITAFPSRNTQERQRTFQTATPTSTYSWGGVVRTQAQYEALRTWVRKAGVVEVTDHLGRVFRVVMQSLKPERKPRRPGSSHRMTYTITAMWIERTT